MTSGRLMSQKENIVVEEEDATEKDNVVKDKVLTTQKLGHSLAKATKDKVDPSAIEDALSKETIYIDHKKR